MLCYLAVLAAFLWERSHGSSTLRDADPKYSAARGGDGRCVALLVVALVVLFAAQLAVVAFEAHADGTATRGLGFPLEVIEDRGVDIDGRRELVSLTMLGIVLLQALTLFVLYRRLERFGRDVPVRVIAFGTLAMVALALAAPALASADTYAYVGDALLGRNVYQPPDKLFAGEFAVINTWWRVPIEPSPYGPLWTSYNHALLSVAPALLGKLLALRFAGALWLGVIFLCALARRVHPGTLALLALNPALIFQFVAEGHNDVVGIALVALGLACAGAGPWLQVPFAIAAGLVKLPLLLIAFVTFAGSWRVRIVACALAVAGVVAASLLLGGQPYVAALTEHVHRRTVLLSWAHAAVAGGALIAVAAAVFRERSSAVASFSFAALAAVIFPWYAAWGLPYAMKYRALAFFTIGLPIAGFLFETALDTRPALFGTILVFLALAIRDLIAGRRREEAHLLASAPARG